MSHKHSELTELQNVGMYFCVFDFAPKIHDAHEPCTIFEVMLQLHA